MKKKTFTYWSSQSFRTLGHWQSGKTGGEYYTGPAFAGLIIGGQKYAWPLILKSPSASVVSGNYFNNTSNQRYLFGNFTASLVNLIGTESEIATNNKHIIKAVWDDGSEWLEPYPSRFINTVGASSITLYDCRFQPIDSGQDEYWRAEVSGSTGMKTFDYLLIPKVHTRIGVFCWYENGYDNLVPQFIKDLQTTETAYSGNLSWLGSISDLNAFTSLPAFCLNTLESIYTPSQRIKLPAKATHYVAPASGQVVRSYYGGYKHNINNVGDDTLAQPNYSKAVGLYAEIDDRWYMAGIPLSSAWFFDNWYSAGFYSRTIDYTDGTFKNTSPCSIMRLFNGSTQVGCVYMTMISEIEEIKTGSGNFVYIS